EAKPIAERVADDKLVESPRLRFEARPRVGIVAIRKLPVEFPDLLHLHKHGGAWRRVAMMLAQMQPQPAARDLHIKRRRIVEAMTPVHSEAEEADIEFL